jgi:hypothetical protein
MRSPRLPVKKTEKAPQDEVGNQQEGGQAIFAEPAPQSDPNMPQWAELIERIKASKFFEDAPDKCNILDFLWQRRSAPPTDVDIEQGLFGNKQPIADIDGTRSRVAVGEVRVRLGQYKNSAKDEKWHATVPKGRGGYRLVFTLAATPLTATQVFWNAHLKSFREPIVITGSHLFFWEPGTSRITRYYDFNSEAKEKDKILEELLSAHPELVKPGSNTLPMEPWRDVYLASGDVYGYEALVRWFHQESSGILIERITSKQITEHEVHRRNAILFGRPETNPIIKTLMDAPPQASKFAFRIHPLKGAIKVSNPDPRTMADLNKFPISRDGVVGPITDDGKVFGIVTRFPNPGGRGHITIVACGHYAMVISRIVEALTDETHAKELLTRMGWPSGEALPDFFEMLFTVDLTPGGLEGEGFPQLVTWRHPQ